MVYFIFDIWHLLSVLKPEGITGLHSVCLSVRLHVTIACQTVLDYAFIYREER